MASVARVAGIDRLTKSQLESLEAAARAIGVSVDWLAAVISFETAGTFSPSVLNAAGSGAFGLIQFLPVTAQNLLKTKTKEEASAKGRAMSFDEQLRRLVVPYFAPYKGRLHSLNDLYLAVFYPAAIGKPVSHVVAKAGTKTYEQNKGFDASKVGQITVGDITRRIGQQLEAALTKPRVVIAAKSVLPLVAVGAGVAWFLLRKGA